MHSMKMNDTCNERIRKKQHMQVFVRVRPMNNSERAGKSVKVVNTPSNKELVVRVKPCDNRTKTFAFDRVFGPLAKQVEVYSAVVQPLLKEVLAGYNCTVLAYGQTGTGKTFTMENFDSATSMLNWQADTTAGFIPRFLSHLFDELHILRAQEYSVRVSFLEIYNEEVYDLLSVNNGAAKIRIYEDSTKKGVVIINGLDEVTVHNKNDVHTIFQKGLEKRHTAATLMNANSSRSHTLFCITVHIKENTINGEELVKTGKLNLVDLAGSENVGRSGAVNKRAKEACNINKSLLTLGRVITALVENTPHIPYRESKLTRLLQESLDGRTRTSIIATVSPASIDLEETLSTLDYALRVKNITIRPEINQKFSKKALVQEYTEEIEKLKRDLFATRNRNGIYLHPENYNQMRSLIDFQNREIEEKLNHIKALENTLHYKEKIFNDLKLRNSEQADEMWNAHSKLVTKSHALYNATSRLSILELENKEQKHLVEKHATTESDLLSQVQSVLEVVDTATRDVHKLHDIVSRKIKIEERNSALGQQTKHNIKERCRKVEADLSTHKEKMTQFCQSLSSYINEQGLLVIEYIEKSIQDISTNSVNPIINSTDQLARHVEDSHSSCQELFKKELENLATMTEHESNINDACSIKAKQIEYVIHNQRSQIAENMKNLETSVSQKLDNITQTTMRFISLIKQASRKSHERINNDIQDIMTTIEEIRQSESRIMQKRCNFAKMMEDLQKSFCQLKAEDERNHATIFNILNNVDKTCNIIKSEHSNACRVKAEKRNYLEEKLQNDLQIMKQTVSEETEKVRRVSQDSVAKAKALISEFQASLETNCVTFKKYQKCVKRNMTKIQLKMKEDKNLILSLINDVFTIVNKAGSERTRSLNTLIKTFNEACSDINKTLRITENFGEDKIIEDLLAVRDRVDKFFVKDLYSDIPTGETPVKKTYQYSRELAKTSPLEPMKLQRYRETLNEKHPTVAM